MWKKKKPSSFGTVYSAIRRVSQGRMQTEINSNRYETDSLVSAVLVTTDEHNRILCMDQELTPPSYITLSHIGMGHLVIKPEIREEIGIEEETIIRMLVNICAHILCPTDSFCTRRNKQDILSLYCWSHVVI